MRFAYPGYKRTSGGSRIATFVPPERRDHFALSTGRFVAEHQVQVFDTERTR